jgi:hypothetical protein
MLRSILLLGLLVFISTCDIVQQDCPVCKDDEYCNAKTGTCEAKKCSGCHGLTDLLCAP